MSAQAAEDLDLIHEISARAATVSPSLIKEGNVVYLGGVPRKPDTDADRIERALALIELYQQSGVINLPELKAVLKGRRSS